jgi:hypothetical protein
MSSVGFRHAASLLGAAATAIGLITGFATIIGWAVSGRAALLAIPPYAGALTVVAAAVATAYVATENSRWFLRGYSVTILGTEYGCAPVFAIVHGETAWVTVIGYASIVIAVGGVSLWSLNFWHSYKASRKTCPDCAEDVRVEARVCRYCGFRFMPIEAGRPSTRDETGSDMDTDFGPNSFTGGNA